MCGKQAAPSPFVSARLQIPDCKDNLQQGSENNEEGSDRSASWYSQPQPVADRQSSEVATSFGLYLDDRYSVPLLDTHDSQFVMMTNASGRAGAMSHALQLLHASIPQCLQICCQHVSSLRLSPTFSSVDNMLWLFQYLLTTTAGI